jgi:hypothetical protein
MVSRAQFTASPLRSVAPVICSVCGSNAHCIRRVPDSHGRSIEYRAFECAVCHRRSYLNVSLASNGNVVATPNDMPAKPLVPNADDIEREVERLIRRAKPQPYPNPEP